MTAVIVLNAADFGGQRGPLIDDLENLQVQSVNLRPEMAK